MASQAGGRIVMGEGPRMFYHALAVMPEWAPPHENHILYSKGVLTTVSYAENLISYYSPGANGTEYLSLNFQPSQVILNGVALSSGEGIRKNNYAVKSLGNGNYYIIITRKTAGSVIIK